MTTLRFLTGETKWEDVPKPSYVVSYGEPDTRWPHTRRAWQRLKRAFRDYLDARKGR